MKKITKIINLILLIFFATTIFAFAKEKENADELFKKAQENESKAYYIKAKELYRDAMTQYLKENKKDMAQISRAKMFKMERIVSEYPFSEEDLKKIFKKAFPAFGEKDFDEWIKKGMFDHIKTDGKTMYFEGALANILFRNGDIAMRVPEKIKGESEVTKKFMDLFTRPKDSGIPIYPFNPYVHPVYYLGTATVEISRKELPKEGIFRLWVPFPIQSASQRDVQIIEITPQEYCKNGPQIDSDLGCVYFEIPLEKLKQDLKIKLRYSFAHYEQIFNIDPNNVGGYDKESELYKRYTKSDANITITDDIRKKAFEIVGYEKNPYICAKKIYDYVLKDIKYSLMPHVYLNQLEISESIFVHEKKFGDCGTQSMYVAAMLRALGIPARCPGGMFIVPGEPAGYHFWGEFYLSNYGWVPYDTTVADALRTSGELDASLKKTIEEYYFAHQDPYRFIIQNNVDVPIYPLQSQPRLCSVVLQMPEAECSLMDKDPSMFVLKKYEIEVVPFKY